MGDRNPETGIVEGGVSYSAEALIRSNENRIEKARAKWKAQNNSCLECSTPIPYAKRDCKFCNQSCAASFNNKKTPKRKRTRPLCPCGGVPRNRNKYCPECLEKGAHLRFLAEPLLGSSDRTRRGYLLRTRELKCQICALETWQGKPAPLVVDHIDGNHTNNTEENLRLICNNCDALLPTFKARNKGNGRAYRRQRYAEGKSY